MKISQRLQSAILKKPLKVCLTLMVVIAIYLEVGDLVVFADGDELYTIHTSNGIIVWDRDMTSETYSFGGIKSEDEIFQIYETLLDQNSRLLVNAAAKFLTLTNKENYLPIVFSATQDGYEAVSQAQLMGADIDIYEILGEFAKSRIQHSIQRIIVSECRVEFRKRYIVKRGEDDNEYLYLADFVICFSYVDCLSDEEKACMQYHSYECAYGYLYSWIESCY